MNLALLFSFLALGVMLVVDAVRSRRLGVPTTIGVVLAILFILFLRARLVFLPWSPRPIARGHEGEIGPAIAVLYGAMVAGMLAQYGFERLSRPLTRRGRFDIGRLLAPIFVSPIVFLPLATAFRFTTVETRDSYLLPVLLVAFENGFFWRYFFERRASDHQTKDQG